MPKFAEYVGVIAKLKHYRMGEDVWEAKSITTSFPAMAFGNPEVKYSLLNLSNIGIGVRRRLEKV